MYEVHDDQLRPLSTVPQSDVGAPLPAIVADEHDLSLAYVISEPDPDWDGSYVNILESDTAGLPIAVLDFARVYVHFLGPPNDEAIEGHPLRVRGLSAYAAYQVESSSWIAALEAMNAVHMHHRPGFLEPYNHYVFTFHDSVFECVARSFRCRTQRGSMRQALVGMAQRLGREEP